MNLDNLFDKASAKHCGDDSCYVGTCPVNCLAMLVAQHAKAKDYWMLFGDYKVIERLSDA